jgi:hypothetical protein
MRDLFPPIEPYDHGMLDAGDGNLIYWETCGNPATWAARSSARGCSRPSVSSLSAG